MMTETTYLPHGRRAEAHRRKNSYARMSPIFLTNISENSGHLHFEIRRKRPQSDSNSPDGQRSRWGPSRIERWSSMC